MQLTNHLKTNIMAASKKPMSKKPAVKPDAKGGKKMPSWMGTKKGAKC